VCAANWWKAQAFELLLLSKDTLTPKLRAAIYSSPVLKASDIITGLGYILNSKHAPATCAAKPKRTNGGGALLASFVMQISVASSDIKGKVFHIRFRFRSRRPACGTPAAEPSPPAPSQRQGPWHSRTLLSASAPSGPELSARHRR